MTHYSPDYMLCLLNRTSDAHDVKTFLLYLTSSLLYLNINIPFLVIGTIGIMFEFNDSSLGNLSAKQKSNPLSCKNETWQLSVAKHGMMNTTRTDNACYSCVNEQYILSIPKDFLQQTRRWVESHLDQKSCDINRQLMHKDSMRLTAHRVVSCAAIITARTLRDYKTFYEWR